MKHSRTSLAAALMTLCLITGGVMHFSANAMADTISSGDRISASAFQVIGSETKDPEAPAAQNSDINSIVPAGGPTAAMNSLSGAELIIDAPEVKAGGSLRATATVTGIRGRVLCDAAWIYDGEPMEGNCGGFMVAQEGASMTAGADLEFSRDMVTEHTIGLRLTYTDPATGQTEDLYNEANVKVNNYSEAYYIQKQNEEAIRNAGSASEVSCVFKGPRSSSYNVDYSPAVKTAFVNEGGYASRTGYLAWVNLATQKVNIFQGSQGNWQLIHTWRCASGASGTETPTGVTYTTYKQAAWITDEYQVKYVTRFYPGSGYAFHSVLYTPDGKSIQSGDVGYPKSHGCVRTEDEGVRWIYNNLPANTTVVIY